MSKRANGEGSIYRQKNGLWAAAVTIGYAANTGKIVRKYVYGKTKQEAQAKKAALLESVKNGANYIDADKITISQWLDKWLETYAKTGVRPNTYSGYASMVKNHLIPQLGALRLQALHTINIQNMVNHITANGGSARLAEAAFNVLRIALNKAFADEIINRLPFKGVMLPQKRYKEFIPLTAAQWQTLFNTAQENPQIYTALSLIWATGISRSELLGLEWSDINWQLGTVSIMRADIITDNGPDINNTKADSRRRVLPIPAVTMETLKKHKTRQTAERLATKTWHNNDYIFPAANGKLQDPRNWSKKMAKVIKKTGLTISTHKLRHDHASRLAENGFSIKDAQYRLGHSTSRMLLDVYTHKMTGGQENIANWLNETFPAEPEKDSAAIENGSKNNKT